MVHLLQSKSTAARQTQKKPFDKVSRKALVYVSLAPFVTSAKLSIWAVLKTLPCSDGKRQTFSQVDRREWTCSGTSPNSQGSPESTVMERWEKESIREQPYHAIGGIKASAPAGAGRLRWPRTLNCAN